MTTGVNAGVHGVWDFTERDESGHHLRLVNGSFRRAPAVWDVLSARGRRVGVVNVPFTWPATEVNGFLLSGLDASARDDDAVFPHDVAGELRRRFGALDLDHAFPLDSSGRIDLDLVRRAVDSRCAALRWLVERFEPELLFTVFMSADHIHHLAWPEWEDRGAESRVAAVYRILDDAVAALCELAGDDGNVMLVSDHGGGSLNGVVNLNAWLAQEGFLAYAENVGVRTEEGRRRLVHRLYALQRALPAGMRSRLARRLPGVRDLALRLREYSVVDWERTRAFSYGTFGNIVVNLRGREEHGVVEPEEYDAVRTAIVERLLELRAPDGSRIVAAVHRREDLFAGACLELLPDLIVEFEDYAWLGKGALTYRTDEIWDEIAIADGSPESYVGSHRHDGVFALRGPAARAARLDARIEDVAPTILYLLGEPIPPELEGRVLLEGIDEALLDERLPEYSEEEATVAVGGRRVYAADAGDEVEARLRGLGYVE
jgi:predicted AlkP superfamily phosphohydrolase/phosphomutase